MGGRSKVPASDKVLTTPLMVQLLIGSHSVVWLLPSTVGSSKSFLDSFAHLHRRFGEPSSSRRGSPGLGEAGCWEGDLAAEKLVSGGTSPLGTFLFPGPSQVTPLQIGDRWGN